MLLSSYYREFDLAPGDADVRESFARIRYRYSVGAHDAAIARGVRMAIGARVAVLVGGPRRSLLLTA